MRHVQLERQIFDNFLDKQFCSLYHEVKRAEEARNLEIKAFMEKQNRELSAFLNGKRPV